MSKILVEVDVSEKITPLFLAQAFVNMNDEEMAQFFIDCARLAEMWPGNAPQESMWHYVGRHLVTCECSTDLAREMVVAIAKAIEQ